MNREPSEPFEALEARILMAAQPDLVITALTPVLPATAGQTVRYEYTIKNQGTAAASLKDVALQTYVSKDSTFKNADDIASGGLLINASSGATLGAGKSLSGSFGASVAFDPFVHKYLTAMIDSNRKLAESNENNNTKATAFPTPYRDQFEDDNSSSAAKTVPTNGNAQNRSIHKAGDVDWAKFTLSAKSNVVIETNGVKGGDNELWLYGPNSSTKQVTYDNNTGTDSYAKITRTLDPGTYHLKTQEYGNNATLGSYTLKVTATALAAGDQYEVDDTAAQAKTFNGDEQRHTLHRSGDVDWLKFSLTKKSAVRFFYKGLIVEGDYPDGNGVGITLFGPNSSTRQIRSVEFGGYDFTDEYGFFASVLEPGTYYIRFTDLGGNDPQGFYTISGEFIPLDTFEPDNSASAARVIGTADSSQSHTLHNLEDVDWMKFTVTQASSASIALTEKSGGSNTYFALYGPDSHTNEILVEYSGRVQDQLLSPGTYYLKVESQGHGGAGIMFSYYDIRVSATPATANRAPVVSGLTASATTITRGQKIKLTATASDPDKGDAVNKVQFWLDKDNDGKVTVGKDQLLHEDPTGTDGWSREVWTGSIPDGASRRILATAFDGEVWSSPRALTLKVNKPTTTDPVIAFASLSPVTRKRGGTGTQSLGLVAGQWKTGWDVVLQAWSLTNNALVPNWSTTYTTAPITLSATLLNKLTPGDYQVQAILRRGSTHIQREILHLTVT